MSNIRPNHRSSFTTDYSPRAIPRGLSAVTRVGVLSVFFLVLAWFALPEAGAIDSEAMDDPVLQTRYVAISKELRCLVCQNQSIQDSNAELAKDLRRQVRGMLNDGRSDDEIYRYMTERYGDYVRYRPPWRLNTMLLQLGPVFIALLGVGMLWATVRRHRSQGGISDTELTETDGMHSDPSGRKGEDG